jgi:hypothetical protein
MSLMETKSSAVAVELATPEMKQAEYSPLTSGSRPMVSMAERSNSKTQMRPWNGPLPPLRISPQRSINDVIVKIMLGQSSTCSCRPSACRSTPVIIGIRGQGACTIRNWWIEREVRALNEIRDSNELSVEGQAKTQSDMYSRAQKVYSMYSNVSYCPYRSEIKVEVSKSIGSKKTLLLQQLSKIVCYKF